jgi:hypothetical protein
VDCALVACAHQRSKACVVALPGAEPGHLACVLWRLSQGLNLEGNVGLTEEMRVPSLIVCGLPSGAGRAGTPICARILNLSAG